MRGKLRQALTIGAPDLPSRPDYATAPDRSKNRKALNAEINKLTKKKSSETWVKEFNAAGVPCDRVMTLPEVFADPQTRDQEMVVGVEHPGHGEVEMLGFPIKFSEAPCRIRRPAPDLGADTDAVLRELGYSPENIAHLREAGIV